MGSKHQILYEISSFFPRVVVKVCGLSTKLLRLRKKRQYFKTVLTKNRWLFYAYLENAYLEKGQLDS